MTQVRLQGDARRRAMWLASASMLVSVAADHVQALVLSPLPQESGPIDAVNLTGTAAGQGAATGAISATLDVAGASSGQGAAAGVPGASLSLAGGASGQGTGGATVTIEEPGVVSLTGTAAGQAEGEGLISALLDLAGASTGQGLGTAAAAFNLTLSGGADGSAVAQGLVVTVADLAGATTAAGTGAGAISTSLTLSGGATSSSAGLGNASAILSLSGGATAEAATTGAVDLSLGLQGASSGLGTAAGAISASLNLSAGSAASGLGAGSISVSLSTIGAGTGSAFAAGAISTSLDLTGAASGSGTGAGVVSVGAPGTWVAASPFVSGTTSCTVNFSATGRTADDLLIIQIETANQAATAPAGWYPLNLSPQGTGTAAAAGAVRKTLFGKKSDGTETTVLISVTSGNHVTAMGHVFRGVDSRVIVNLFLNSEDFTNTSYWKNDGTATITSSATPGPLGETAYRVQMASGGTRGDKYLYADAGISPNLGGVMKPNTTYRLFYSARSSSGTSKFAMQYFLNSASIPDTSYWGPDITATTTWTRYKLTFTTDSSTLYYANIALNAASDTSAVDIIIAEFMIAEGDLDISTPYAKTTAAAAAVFPGVNAAAGTTQSASTTFTCPGPTTTADNTLVAVFIANDRDFAGTTNLTSPANANLTGVTLRADQTVSTGVGGGIGLITGVKATAGAVGNTTVTNAASNANASITLALAPAA